MPDSLTNFPNGLSTSVIVLTGEGDIFVEGEFISTYNGEGIIPTSQSPAGFAITSNYAGFGEVDFWSLVNNTDAESQGFRFMQKLTAGTARPVMHGYTYSTGAELDIFAPNGTTLLMLGVTNAGSSITTGTGSISLGAPGGVAVTLGRFGIPTNTPASATATGVQGTIAWDANFIYVCTATNTWKRVAIATW